MQSRFLSLVLASLLFISCNGQNSKSIKTIDAKSFAEKLKTTENPQLVDVRTPEEYSTGRIAEAINVNWNGTDFEAKAKTFDKSKPIFVYCKAGGRSSDAANKLASMGFTEIYNLEGGIMKWNASEKVEPGAKIIGMCDQEYGELTKSSDKVVIDFNAKWCTPCQKMKPFILKMQAEMKNSVKIVQLDADENKTMVEQLKLDGLPTIIVYEKGREVWRNTGYISEEELRKHL